jgi:hypothetical protein
MLDLCCLQYTCTVAYTAKRSIIASYSVNRKFTNRDHLVISWICNFYSILRDVWHLRKSKWSLNMNQYDKDRDSNKLTCDCIEVKPNMS